MRATRWSVRRAMGAGAHKLRKITVIETSDRAHLNSVVALEILNSKSPPDAIFRMSSPGKKSTNRLEGGDTQAVRIFIVFIVALLSIFKSNC
jgi:hypothetical protein